jgi:YD repeat-containing protein
MKRIIAVYWTLGLMAFCALPLAAQTPAAATNWGALYSCTGGVKPACLRNSYAGIVGVFGCSQLGGGAPGVVCQDYGDTPGLGGCICGYPSSGCPPPKAQCECKGKCCGSNNSSGSNAHPECSQPISLETGNTYITQNDIKSQPGLGYGIGLSRTWNSLWPDSQMSTSAGLFGNYWRSTYEESVFTGDDGYVKYSRADGNYWSFGWAASGTYQIAAPSNAQASLTAGASFWTVTFQNGEQRRFDNNSGGLIAVIDRNGNTTTVAHDAYGRISKVTDPNGRYLIFYYELQNSPYLATQVTSSVGHRVTYTYSAAGQLTQVTETDGTVYSFGYADPNPVLITTVTDAQGKILEAHTYDSYGRGLTSTRANGVEAVTVSYQSQ